MNEERRSRPYTVRHPQCDTFRPATILDHCESARRLPSTVHTHPLTIYVRPAESGLTSPHIKFCIFCVEE